MAVDSKPWYALKLELEAAKAEIAQLREALELKDAHTDEDSWGIYATQELRDKMAATALIAEKLDEPRALKRLGFQLLFKENGKHLHPDMHALRKRIFGTPGVKAILERDMEDAEANKARIIARLVQTSMHGEDGEATRAVQQLAKMAKWNDNDKNALPANVTLNLMQMFSERGAAEVSSTTGEIAADNDGVIDAEFFLTHEPGDPTKVIDTEQEALTK